MKKVKNQFFLTSFVFLLTFSLGLGFLFFYLPQVQAVDVGISADIVGTGNNNAICGNGLLETGETCDGSAGSGNCPNNTCNGDCTCPFCGDGVIEAGETCEQDSDCDEGETCNTSCGCQAAGSNPPICIAGPLVCVPVGPCIDGQQARTCNNGCAVSQDTVVCGTQVCGNGVVEGSEECDDSSACCVSCQVQMIIQNVNDSVIGTTATVTWEVVAWQSNACAPVTTNSLIEWGKNGSYNEGSANLTGTTFSHEITNLTPQSVYTYRITASTANRSDADFGSFSTLSEEICTNGLDDDGDGLIDSQDPDCSTCTAIWNCNVDNVEDAECIDGQKSKVCTQDPSDECTDTSNNPSETIGCASCEGVTCPTGQTIINNNTCECGIEPGICGNDLCEPSAGEDLDSCPQDCSVSCVSDWQCDEWQPAECPASGIQTQNCVDLNACAIPTNPPPTSRSCGSSCPGLSCGVGEKINTELCSCEAVVPFCGNGICESGENFVSCGNDCIAECAPNWLPSAWGPCVSGTQQRAVDDLNNCNLNLDPPPTIRSCNGVCDPAVACGLGQNIDIVNCRCNDIVPFCGNSVCEEGEFVWSCPVDCGLPPEFRLKLTACLNGLDDDNDGLTDYPEDPGCSSPSDNNELNIAEVLENVREVIGTVIDNEQVEQVNETAAPVLVTAITVNTFASFSFFNFASYLRYFFTQPFAALFRRKRKKWGVVYNSLTKQPIDLAIVRLYDKKTNRIVQSRVTDSQGRYSFLAPPGNFYITVTKPKYDFPTDYLKGKKEDSQFLDLYHGEGLAVSDKKASITANIPVDPQVEEKPVKKVLFQHYLRKAQYVAAFSAIPLALVSVIISPGPMTIALLGFHSFLYILFRRLGYKKPPKNWGIIYDKNSKKPLGRAIARIYDKKYNKLLETRVTDAKGRYSFLVNKNVYVVTAEKPGYQQVKTSDIDLEEKGKEAVVGMDIGLPKHSEAGAGVMPAPAVSQIKPDISAASEPKSLSPDDVAVSLQQAQQPARAQSGKPSITRESLEDKIDKLSVTRESLQDLIKQKQGVKDVEQEIDAKQAELDKLEDKAKELEQQIEEKIGEGQAGENSKNPKKDLPPKPPEKSIFS